MGSIGFVTWRCISPGNFETELPDYSNCSTTWIVEIQTDVADIESMPALNASRYLHQMEKTTSSPGDDGGNISYYGHEIKQIVDLGVEILNKVERTVGIRIVENLTRKTFGVFRNLLTTTAPWNELKHVCLLFVIHNTQILEQFIESYTLYSSQIKVKLGFGSSNRWRLHPWT